jgi:AbrB family looped-hinge helix DNA binding protein
LYNLKSQGEKNMLAELRSRSQITIPAEIIKSLDIHEGDQFEVIEKDGGIFLCPIVVYPKAKMEALKKLICEVKEGKDVSRTYDDLEELFTDLEGKNEK